jgi:hypothetical protein
MMPDSMEKLLRAYGWDTHALEEEWLAKHREELYCLGRRLKDDADREVRHAGLVQEGAELILCANPNYWRSVFKGE